MLANAITSIRIALLPLLFGLILAPGARWAALAVLVVAGLTDIVDGRIARARGETSRLGAMLDLIADRLLTLTVLAGLIAAGELPGAWSAAAALLIARDLVVASFGESAPDLRIGVTALERVKIALQFAAFGLLTAPAVVALQYAIGRWTLAFSALVAGVTVWSYAGRAADAVRRSPADQASGREKNNATSPSAGVAS
jgi:cardiolipin synthase (CMP-forming)